MRIVFAGTPQVAIPALDALLRSRHEVAAVVTRPDAPAGRGRRPRPSPIADRARQAGIEVLAPRRVGDPVFLDRLRRIAPDCCAVVAYGALLPEPALAIPRHGWVNLHFSLLPAWRGPAPVQHAILHGDDITGATTFRIVAELDAGPVYGVVTEPIRDRDTAGELTARLARSGAELLVRTLDGIEAGRVRAVPQAAGGASYAPKITPADARVDWSRPASAIDRLIRACTPTPGAWTTFRQQRLKLGPVISHTGSLLGEAGRSAADQRPDDGHGTPEHPPSDRHRCAAITPLRPGELLVTRGDVLVGTGSTPVRLGDVQPPGKRRMPAVEWARGLRLHDHRPRFD